MAFPAASVVPPTLPALGIEFNGLTMGPNTCFGLRGDKGPEGLRGMPQMRTGDNGRPRDHGEFAGLNVLPGRTMTITIDVGPPFGSYGNLKTAMTALATALIPAGTISYPLWYSEDGSTVYASLARALASTVTIDTAYSLGNIAQGIPIQFKMLDPRWYLAPTVSQTLNLAGSSGGLTFPFTFPLSFGASLHPNTVTLVNSGNIDTRPLITITGPCTNPSVQNQSQTGNPTIQFLVAMSAGDTLVLDTDLESATYTYAGSSVGFSVENLLGPSALWWTLPANSSQTVAFYSGDTGTPAGTCNIQSASAYLL